MTTGQAIVRIVTRGLMAACLIATVADLYYWYSGAGKFYESYWMAAINAGTQAYLWLCLDQLDTAKRQLTEARTKIQMMQIAKQARDPR